MVRECSWRAEATKSRRRAGRTSFDRRGPLHPARLGRVSVDARNCFVILSFLCFRLQAKGQRYSLWLPPSAVTLAEAGQAEGQATAADISRGAPTFVRVHLRSFDESGCPEHVEYCRRDIVLFRASGRNRGRVISPRCGPLAQLAEQQTLNLRVDGSIPSRLTFINFARVGPL
jgi:hypothetical protein